MLNNKYKLSKYVLKRFEKNANEEGGLEILYNTRTNEYWFGNASSRYLINSFDGISSLEKIFISLSQTIFKEFSIQEIKESFISIIEELEKKRFIEKI